MMHNIVYSRVQFPIELRLCVCCCRNASIQMDEIFVCHSMCFTHNSIFCGFCWMIFHLQCICRTMIDRTERKGCGGGMGLGLMKNVWQRVCVYACEFNSLFSTFPPTASVCMHKIVFAETKWELLHSVWNLFARLRSTTDWLQMEKKPKHTRR